MIIVENSLRTLELEIEALNALEPGPNMKLIRRGMVMALTWIKDGGVKPSEQVVSNTLP